MTVNKDSKEMCTNKKSYGWSVDNNCCVTDGKSWEIIERLKLHLLPTTIVTTPKADLCTEDMAC